MMLVIIDSELLHVQLIVNKWNSWRESLMTHKQIEQFCEDVRENRFGGAAEMVDSAVNAILLSLRDSKAASIKELDEELDENVDSILYVMPSIAPMINLLHRAMGSLEVVVEKSLPLEQAKRQIEESIAAYHQRQNDALKKIGRFGGQLIRAGDKIATYSTSGTVQSIFRNAIQEGKNFSVVVTESRPASEGYRTMRETAELGITVTLGIDATLGVLLKGCSMFVVGADVITSGGEVLAKVGTYLGTLVARDHGIPFYVASDTSKFDPMTLEGFPIKIRDKGAAMVTKTPIPANCNVINPSFELIPAHLVTGIITEVGIVHPGSVATMMRSAQLSQRLGEKLYSWIDTPSPE
jgi:eIF-2B alpha/beta/delta-like uncharacterized protein